MTPTAIAMILSIWLGLMMLAFAFSGMGGGYLVAGCVLFAAAGLIMTRRRPP